MTSETTRGDSLLSQACTSPAAETPKKEQYSPEKSSPATWKERLRNNQKFLDNLRAKRNIADSCKESPVALPNTIDEEQGCQASASRSFLPPSPSLLNPCQNWEVSKTDSNLSYDSKLNSHIGAVPSLAMKGSSPMEIQFDKGKDRHPHPQRVELKHKLSATLDSLHLPWGASEEEVAGMVEDTCELAVVMDAEQAYFTLLECGELLAQHSRSPEALQCLEAAIAVVPESLRAHFRVGNLLMGENQLREATKYYTKALQLIEDSCAVDVASMDNSEALLPRVLINLGVVHEKKGDLEEAARFYRRATEVAPRHAKAHKLLGSCLLDLQQYHFSRAALEAAVEVCPEFCDAQCDLGCALVALGEWDQAEAALLTALSLAMPTPTKTLPPATTTATSASEMSRPPRPQASRALFQDFDSCSLPDHHRDTGPVGSAPPGSRSGGWERPMTAEWGPGCPSPSHQDSPERPNTRMESANTSPGQRQLSVGSSPAQHKSPAQREESTTGKRPPRPCTDAGTAPARIAALFNLGILKSKTLDWELANTFFLEVLEIDPWYWRARLQRVPALRALGREDEAEREMLRVMDETEGIPDHSEVISQLNLMNQSSESSLRKSWSLFSWKGNAKSSPKNRSKNGPIELF